MPSRALVFGMEPAAFQANHTDPRAACVIKPLPFYWLGEVLMELPESDADRMTGSRFRVARPRVEDMGMLAMLEVVESKYGMLSRARGNPWDIFDGDDRAVLAREMLDMAEHEDVPERGRIAMAGRLIERASRVPGRVVFAGW